MISFILNDKPVRAAVRPGTALLEYIRETACLSGTKEACREGECGACTVLVGRPRDGGTDYRACASCLLPIGDIDGCHVVTVEGLSQGEMTLPQRLVVEHGASQCGFCTPGIVLSLTGFALCSPGLSYEDALDALDGNICRCTGYASIRSAASALAAALQGIDKAPAVRTGQLIKAGVLPGYFTGIPALLAALPQSAAPGPDAVVVAGGTDLFVQRPEQLRETELCFVSRRRDLDYVREEGGLLRMGGAVTIEDFRNSDAALKYFPSLAADLLLHSSAILRNKATLAGNIVNASPIGDATIMLLALGARLVITGESGARREVPLDKFYLGYKKTALACGELVTEIIIPLPPAGSRFHFEKVSNRAILDIAAVNSAALFTLGENGLAKTLRVSAGGVGPVPMLLPGLEKLAGLGGEALAEGLAAAAAAAAAPIDDIRGSAEYKKLLLGQLMRAHVKALAPAEAA